MTFDRLQVLLIALLFAAGCQPPAKPGYVTVNGSTMGTTWTVQLEITGEEQEAKLLKERISGLLETIEQQMSTWREDSKISQFNVSNSTNWISTTPHITTVLRKAREVSRATDGAFDVTVQPLVKLWGFGSETVLTNAPPADRLKATLAATGFDKLRVRDRSDEMRKMHPQTQVDLSALAKGFAVDLVSEFLDEMKYTNYLVEIGGELRGRGNSRKGRAWRVGLELPLVGRYEIGDAVDLSNNALATSGDYRNFLDLEGKRYAHIVDPRTGFPIEQHGIAVSVLAPTCMEADAWATALTVLGPERGLKLAELNRIAAHFRMFQNDELVQQSTSRWPKNL